jgi:L-threonylcarbamoyladenylate synthase
VGLESTVLDLTVWPPLVLRPGGVSLEELREVVPETDLDPALLAGGNRGEEFVPRSPGLKYTHYSPRAKVVLVQKGQEQVAKMGKVLDCYRKLGKRVGILCRRELGSHFGEADLVLELTSGDDLSLAAHNLFDLLRRFDQEEMEVIIVEGVSPEGIGLAVMNRLTKAAEEIY